jgi:glycosyltransferase involved in cell wall biosynthesis
MKILQIAPPWFTVPPAGYGGIESIVAVLVEGLIERGEDVTLLASGGSDTSGTLLTVFDTPPTADLGSALHEVVHLLPAYRRRHDFDLIHDHSGVVGAAITSMWDGPPIVHTQHGPWHEMTREFYAALPPQLHLVDISRHQASNAPEGAQHAGVVYNGIPVERYPLRKEPRGRDGYLCFLGRASPDKGPDAAIRMATQLRRRLVMMVKINEPEEREYWEGHCAPLLGGADVEVHPDVSPEQKAFLLAGADAMLFPIQWDEPFGLVMAEAMACGTPVIAYRRGAAPEVVVHEHTGFLIDPGDEDAFIAAVGRVGAIEPAACRAHVQRHFSAQAMVQGYRAIYQQVTSGGQRLPTTTQPVLRPAPKVAS